MSDTSIGNLFHIDMLSIIMICLVSFIGIIVFLFSRTYMKGDSLYHKFSSNMVILLLSVFLMTIADNLLLFMCAWGSCNWMMGQLIVHKTSWSAAKASGQLATRNFLVGFMFIILAFAMMYKQTGSLSIQYIVHNSNDTVYMSVALMMLLIGAMTQSAIWPFHRWLISSLNSPTPVSAIMHAGIVNGGGFLLARFAPLFFNTPNILIIIFTVGITSALLGSLWKLMQHDVKRMLACSTMGQMGFMIAQCGLGLFSSAVAHLCWHGMFKAYLFLTSGSAAQEKKLELRYPPSMIRFTLSLACGCIGSYVFAVINNEPWLPLDTTLIIAVIVYITSTQFALTVLRDKPFKRLPLAIILTSIMSALYGANVYLFDYLFSSLELIKPQPLNIFHLSALIILILSWMLVLFAKCTNQKSKIPNFLLRLYVKALNSSQPHPDTITANRKGYDYV